MTLTLKMVEEMHGDIGSVVWRGKMRRQNGQRKNYGDVLQRIGRGQKVSKQYPA